MVLSIKRTALIWLGLGLWMAGTIISLGSLFQPLSSPALADTLAVPPNRLLVYPDGPVLLESEGLTLVTATEHHLLLNEDTLLYNSTMLGGVVKIQADKQARWRGYLSLLLREPGQRDSTQEWVTARLKLLSFVGALPSSPPLPDDILLDRFVTTVKQRQQTGESTLIRRGQLVRERLSVRIVKPNEQWQAVVITQPAHLQLIDNLLVQRFGALILWLALVLLVWVIYTDDGRTVQSYEVWPTPVDVSQEPPSTNAADEPSIELDEVNQVTNPLPEPRQADLTLANTDQYIAAFFRHYGGFYKRIQQLPLDAPEEERQRIRRELVEMALHAHDFVQVCTYKDPQRMTESPNVYLLLNNSTIGEMPPDQFRTLSLDPYRTEKRYRLLVRILQEMNIGELEGALLNDVYVPKSLLMPLLPNT